MSEPMPTTSIIPALINFQKEVPAIPKNCENKFFSQGGRKAMYADLSSVIDICAPVLNKNGLVISQVMTLENGKNGIKTNLFHSSGECLSSQMALPEIADAQKLTAAITYLRRAQYLSILGLVAEDDQDGNDIPGTKPQESKSQNTPPTDKDVKTSGGSQMTGPAHWRTIKDLAKKKGVEAPFVKFTSDYEAEMLRLNKLPDAKG